MEFLRSAAILRSRLVRGCVFLSFLTSSRSSAIRLSSTVANDQPKKAVAKQQRSILEEILVKKEQQPKTTTQKIVQKAENTFFYAILAASVAALGMLGYVLFEQFFTYESPERVYSSALSIVRADERCQELFGSTIAGYGEDSGRGRRRHVAHQKYEKNGKQRMRVLFHLQGSKGKGIAQAEMEKDGSWQWRFLLVQTEGRHPEAHVLIDNREPE
uniref:Mitochondrial import inner membrane translocase subunit Tim21 n=1 Tax=Syphacia muris TaxID=451379 RepID=A0A0N5AR02_9BILA